jgi:hypothetical protein
MTRFEFALIRNFLMVLILLMVMPAQDCLSQVRLTHVNKPEAILGKKGVIYNLPRTMLVVDLQVTRIQKFPGPYADYAKDFLGMENPIKSPSTEYEISNVQVHSYPEPDPLRYYLVEWNEKSDQELWLSLTRSGLIAGTEKFPKEPAVQGFEEWNQNLYTTFGYYQLFKYAAEPNFYEKIDTIKRILTVDTVSIQKVSYKHYTVPLSDKEKAQKAANQINSVNQDKYNLLVGYQETPYTKDALSYMIGQLDEIREENLKLFAGTTVRETLMFSFRYMPDSLSDGVKIPFAGFSGSEGLTEPAAEHHLIEIMVKRSGMTATLGDESGFKGKPGFIYRIPEPSEVTITYLDKVLLNSTILVSQYGVIRSLPANVTKVDFDPETGSILKVVVR